MPSTGWTTQHNQPINKTIGINKLGTLLSSQTTDTPGTTTTPQGTVTRSGATFQTYPITNRNANRRTRRIPRNGRVPTRKTGAEFRTIFQAVYQGVGRYLSASAAATRITLHTNTGPHKSGLRAGPAPKTPETRDSAPLRGRKNRRRAQNRSMCARSPPGGSGAGSGRLTAAGTGGLTHKGPATMTVAGPS